MALGIVGREDESPGRDIVLHFTTSAHLVHGDQHFFGHLVYGFVRECVLNMRISCSMFSGKSRERSRGGGGGERRNCSKLPRISVSQRPVLSGVWNNSVLYFVPEHVVRRGNCIEQLMFVFYVRAERLSVDVRVRCDSRVVRVTVLGVLLVLSNEINVTTSGPSFFLQLCCHFCVWHADH